MAPDATVSVPTQRERRALVSVLARAFRDNPMNRAIHGPSPSRRLRANRAGLRSLVLDHEASAETRVIRNEGRVVGGFVAVAPGRYPLPGASLRRQLGCFFWQGARAMDRWSFVSDALHRRHPSSPYWYLAVLGVDPVSQGRGFGGRLLAALGELAARQPAPIHLESDRAESVDFYRARGFEPVESVLLLEVPCWRLERRAEGLSSGEGTDLCDALARRSALAETPPPLGARRAERSEVAP